MESTESEFKNGRIVEQNNLNIAQSKDDEVIQKKRCRVDSIITYDVTEDELECLKKTSSKSTILNFAVSAVSIAITTLFFVLTLDFATREKTYIFALALLIVTTVLAIVLFIMWYKSSDEFDNTIKKIKARY